MDYAFLDAQRTRIIYANASDIVRYKSVRCYCKNPNCNARMFIHNPEHPSSAYFQASGKPSHNGSCGSKYHHFDRSMYNESLFRFPDALMNLESVTTPSSSGGKSSSTGTTSSLKGLKTVKEIYRMATNTPPNDEYNGTKIKDLLADIRSYTDYANGITGYRLVECNYFRYENKVLIMNFPFFPQNEYLLRLNFEDENLFREEKDRFFTLKHSGIIVVSGLWNTVNELYYGKTIKAECTIYSEKQIGIIKKG